MITFTKQNSLMTELLQQMDNSTKSKKIMGDYERLFKLFSSDIIEFHGCTLLASNINLAHLTSTQKDVISDKTRFESFENHLHCSDFLSPKFKRDVHSLLKVGLIIAYILSQKLAFMFPTVKFRIDVACNVKSLYEETKFEDSFNDCTVRFHELRDGDPSYLNDDLEKYLYDAVGYIDIG